MFGVDSSLPSSVRRSSARTGAAMTRDRATVAVLMFDQAPIFEISVPIGVFGADCTVSGAPRCTLLPVAGEPGVLASTGGVQLHAPHGLGALRHAGIVIAPSWRG